MAGFSVAETSFGSVRDEKKKAPEGALKASARALGMRGSGPVWVGNARSKGWFQLHRTKVSTNASSDVIGLCRGAAQRLRRRPLARTCFR